MSPFEDAARDEHKEPIAVNELPDWALSYARGAINSGRTAPEIQNALVSKGLTESLAAAAVDRCFEARIGEELQRERRATQRRWASRIASIVVVTGILVIANPEVLRQRGIGRIVGLIFPALAFIWFPKTLGSYTGPIGLRAYVTTPTPAFFMVLAGWLVLAVVAVAVIVLSL